MSTRSLASKNNEAHSPRYVRLDWRAKMDHIIAHYSVNEVREMFKGNDWKLDPDEEARLWETLSLLKKEQVDILQKEIHLIILSQQKSKPFCQKTHKGMYLKLRDRILKRRGRKGTIILSPYFFGDEQENNPRDYMAYTILHEIAHHRLKHSVGIDPRSVEEMEVAAIELATKWSDELGLQFRLL
jgi:hypothetical protein